MTKKLLDYFAGDELAASTWENKYALRDDRGELVETSPEEMHHRLAKEFWRVEKDFIDKAIIDRNKLSKYGQRRKDLSEETIFKLFDKFKYIVPAGSVMAGAGGNKPVSLSNCFVLPTMPKDSYTSIMMSRLELVQLLKRRGGCGIDISNLRPRGAFVNNAAKTSTGAASFMEGYSSTNNEVAAQGRRGAIMLTISVLHPDSPEFIEIKQDLTKVTGANVSVKIPDEFMKAVEEDKDFLLRWPISEEHKPILEVEMEYNTLYPSQYIGESGEVKRGYIKKIRAKELWDKLIHCAWNTAEPGILFESTLHNYAPDGIYPKYKATSTNPCIVGDTKVLIKISGKEEIVEVESLPGRMIDDHIEVLSFNLSTNTIEWKDLQRAHLTKRNADIIILIVSDGTNNLELKLTPDHKVYSIIKSGYIEAKDLSIGESVWTYIDGNLSRAEIISKESCLEKEDVFDLTVKDNHNFFANGILIKNCGEIPMAGDSCRLIHCNLSSLVDNPFTEKAEINFEKVYSVFYEATRLGDDLVTLEEEAVNRILSVISPEDIERKVWEELLDTARKSRRSGIGFFGLSDMIAMLGLKFCSPESIEIVDKVCHKMMEAELDAEVDLAIERGMFPAWNKTYETADANRWYKFISSEYPEQWERMQKHGRRNISFSTVAPTGCLVGSTELLVDGSNMSIQEFFKKNNINIEELEDKKSIWFDPIDKFFVNDIQGNKHLITKLYWNGISKTKKLKFQNNEAIECTNSHKFLVKVDNDHAVWKTAEEIKPGDKLIQSVRNNNPVESNDVKEDIELFDLKDLQYSELEVISVEDSVNLTMDIEVGDTHYYTLSNGLISHNTVAMISRASSGIEPVFMPFYMRRRKCNSDSERVDFVDKMGIKFQEFIVVHPGLEEWAKITYPGENIKDWKLDKWQEVFEKSPWFGSTSPEIDWEKRVELQGVVQKYITHAISSTVNLPNNVTEDEVSKIYMTAWKTGNKGQTIYRDGSRDGILVKAEEKRRDDKFRSYVEAPKRPKVLPADFYTTKVKGELFYVMVGLYLDKPYEIFVFKPDLGENEKPPKQHRGEITKIKRGVYTFKSDLITIENISKDLSPIEYTVVLFSSMLLRTGANIKYVIKTAQKAKDGINGFTSALVRILSKYSPDELLKGETCPECGGTLVRESGCIMCKDCGYSKCL